MTPRAGAVALVCDAALAGLLALPACAKHAKTTEPAGPFLSMFSTDGGYRARSLVTPAAVTLALGGLPPDELPRLQKHLADSTDGALQRAAPELFDLDAPPDAGPGLDPMRDSLPDLPALTAAANVLGAPWEAPAISVHLGPACDAAATRCVPLLGPVSAGDDALQRRGRALAWALGHAALLRAPPETRSQLLSSLRAAQVRPAGTIAMVFDASRGSLDANELDALRREARRAIEPLRAEALQRPWLEALAAARPEWELPVALDADQVLVVPRLRVLARLADFVSEVAGASTGLRCTLVRQPTP
jgi:hypothetical protein